MTILALDLGTTNCKAAVVDHQGTLCAQVSHAVKVRKHQDGTVTLDADGFWDSVQTVIKMACSQVETRVELVAIASMAETGLLIDRRTKQCLTDLIPWYDKGGQEQLHVINSTGPVSERFSISGIRPSFKCGLAKLLSLKEQGIELRNGVWLSASDYIAWKLTGELGTDHTLAARTYCFSIVENEWDENWIKAFGIEPDVFPPAFPSGSIVGRVSQRGVISPGTPVAICGHDHVVASAALGAISPGDAYNSMGTAEVLVGTIAQCKLGTMEYNSGLTYGPHVLPNQFCWMGGISASGASIEWLRGLVSDTKLSYEEMGSLLTALLPGPTGILYFPYLFGAGAPLPDPAVRAAFVGLKGEHTKAHLVKAVLEGTAYEFQFLRQAAKQVTGLPLSQIQCVGGGTRNNSWVQIKADVTNCSFIVPQVEEATLLGAALVAGLRNGLYSENDLHSMVTEKAASVFKPDKRIHEHYKIAYDLGYLKLQTPLREYSEISAREKWG